MYPGLRGLLILAENAKRLGAHVAYTIIDGIRVRAPRAILASRIEGIVEEFRSRFKSIEGLLDHPHVKAYRSMFWRMKIDPTKTRPSPEALARRVLRGAKLPSINNVVDAGNAASLHSLISIGLYDLDKINPPITIRITEGGVFEPIGGKAMNAKGLLVAQDSSDTIIHVYAHRDSRKTMVTESTRRLLAIAYGAPGIDARSLKDALLLFQELLEEDGLHAGKPIETVR